ncbi:MAG TPA: HEAT repeat domain-containing protein, partial [Bacteroidota bacterium]|nr:HEAT repeat domain-containing protein [Bacteroidota bacterium]
TRMMGVDSWTGSWNSDDNENTPALCEVLGIQPCVKKLWSHDGITKMTLGDCTTITDAESEHLIPKEVAILFEMNGSSSKTDDIDKIETSNMSLHVRLNDEPVFWLGKTADSASNDFLASLYNDDRGMHLKKEIVSTIGLSARSEQSFAFLAKVLSGKDETEIRKDAAFWLGQSNSDRALDLLMQSAQNDKSSAVRENCVFAISQMKGDRSVDSLIALAQKSENEETRKKAIFWLSQKAGKKATAALENAVYDDKDYDIQKSALFALTQLPEHDGVDIIIKVATTHPNPKIRKDAIFWLGESGDQRALKTLIDIIHN